MNDLATLDSHAVVTAPLTLQIQRLLPGPIERCWAYLTESDLRRQWLASGEMKMEVGAPFELVWRHHELAGAPGEAPEGFPEEHRMESRIIALDPPRRLVFAWRDGDVTFELAPQGNEVLLTLTHRRVSDRPNLVGVSAGWHAHLDLLVAVASGRTPPPFWANWNRLKPEYEARTPA